MQFKIKRPCESCPFRKDVSPFLHRAPQIVTQLEDDYFWFACHETTGMKSGKRVKPEKQSHCAGAMMVLWKSGTANIAMRLALLYKLITREQLEQDVAVFDSLEEFAAHHESA
jgi:hypothetical protein